MFGLFEQYYVEQVCNTKINENNEIIQEGVFSGIINTLKILFKSGGNKKYKPKYEENTGFVSSSKEYSEGENMDTYYIANSLINAIPSLLTPAFYNINGNRIIINKKSEEDVNNRKEFIYKVKVVDKKSFPYKVSIIKMEMSGTVLEIIKKLKFTYEFKDTSSIEAERKKLYDKIYNICKSEIDKWKKSNKDENTDFLNVIDYNNEEDKDPYNEFIMGDSNEINIIDGDAWDYSESIRDSNVYEKYIILFNKLYEAIDKRISSDNSINGKIEYYGDWDGIIIGFEFK